LVFESLSAGVLISMRIKVLKIKLRKKSKSKNSKQSLRVNLQRISDS
jgi:hypothetical protein